MVHFACDLRLFKNQKSQTSNSDGLMDGAIIIILFIPLSIMLSTPKPLDLIQPHLLSVCKSTFIFDPVPEAFGRG